MTPSKEIDELRNKKAQLEEESVQLDEKEKNLEERVQILEERIAIRGLEEHNQSKMDAIDSLETKMNELEQKLKSPLPPTSKEPQPEPEHEKEAVTPMEEPPTEEVAETASEEHGAEEEPAEDYVEVTPIEDVQTPQFEEAEQVRKQHDKKKRKFF